MIIHSKHDGWVKNVRLVYGGDSGGPTNQKVEQTNIPEYARPYVEDMLGRTQALTTQNPYQQYTGQRVADATGLQQQSYGAAANLQPASQIGTATGIAGGVANQAGAVSQYAPGTFNPGTDPGKFTNTGVAASYMNPYTQQVVDIQKREAMRSADMMGQRDASMATGAGAFGGSRHAIVDAERERNLGTQLNDIQAQGANAAWQQAMQAFGQDQNAGLQWNTQRLGAQQLGEQSRQYGAGLGIQGLQTQLGAGQLLQGLGQNQYNQQLGIAGLQNQFGTQQQALAQQGLDIQAQDFENRNMWPYRQLEFQNAMVRGLPLSQTTTSMYEAPPSPISQLAGLGTAMYGMSRMADGGIVEYAEGGEIEYRDPEKVGGPFSRYIPVEYENEDGTVSKAPKKGRNTYKGAPLIGHTKPAGAGRGHVKKYAEGGAVGLADLLIAQIK